jgi:hypothetical protein
VKRQPLICGRSRDGDVATLCTGPADRGGTSTPRIIKVDQKYVVDRVCADCEPRQSSQRITAVGSEKGKVGVRQGQSPQRTMVVARGKGKDGARQAQSTQRTMTSVVAGEKEKDGNRAAKDH